MITKRGCLSKVRVGQQYRLMGLPKQRPVRQQQKRVIGDFKMLMVNDSLLSPLFALLRRIALIGSGLQCRLHPFDSVR